MKGKKQDFFFGVQLTNFNTLMITDSIWGG